MTEYDKAVLELIRIAEVYIGVPHIFDNYELQFSKQLQKQIEVVKSKINNKKIVGSLHYNGTGNRPHFVYSVLDGEDDNLKEGHIVCIMVEKVE